LKQGALLGAGVSEYAPMTGSNVSEALESGLDIDRVQAIRAGFVALPQAAIGVFGEAGLVKLLAERPVGSLQARLCHGAVSRRYW